MLDLGPHAAFIFAAYGVTFVAVAALALFIVEDDRKQRRLLAELERKGSGGARPSRKPHAEQAEIEAEGRRMSQATRAPMPCGVSGWPCRS